MLLRLFAISFGISLLLGSNFIWSQTVEVAAPDVPKDWFLGDPEGELVQGISAEKAYALLKGRTARTVTVAVIDSGIDIDHEDLKTIIWTNDDEIAGNNIDDDNNGYVDDVHGWNFIGGKNGNVGPDTYELTREYMRLKSKYENGSPKKPSKKDKAEMEDYKKIKEKFEGLKESNEKSYNLYSKFYNNLKFSLDTLSAIYQLDSIERDKISGIRSSDPVVLFAKGYILNFMNNTSGKEFYESLEELKEAVEHYEVIVKYGYNEEFNSREIVGDDYHNLAEKHYGNNDVKGSDAVHGTHVAGIIAADRTNEIGIRGIADKVWVMPVRAVPNGDERDKDIANAIYYAVDNGANIINMSFGKGFSPQKAIVDKAVRYAEQKGVLLIHAAGNDGDNNDKEPNFPNRFYSDGKESKVWLEIGASTYDEKLVTDFSNYGKKTTDLFAPGDDIYSTIPGNKYKNQDGTSMASPVASGVAAILMSYFPDLTALQVKDILRQSSRKFDGLRVSKPGSKDKVDFSELSITGGIINAYEAVKLAMTISKPVEK